MRVFWNKYRLMIILAASVILLFIGTVGYYRHKNSSLRKQLSDTEIEHALEIDRMMGDIIREQLRKTDSLLMMERRRYDSLQLHFTQTKKEYEKNLADYSSIVIDRPEY